MGHLQQPHAAPATASCCSTAAELDKLQRAGQDKGLTIVGLRMFLNERGLVKIVIGLARGRKTYDKREYLKENDAKREIDKAMKTTDDDTGDFSGCGRDADQFQYA